MIKDIILDEKQQEIVNDVENKKIMVVAGSGSGKTRVLTERVRNLLLNGVEPHNIVCITYTNAAADEMKYRLKDIEGISDAFVGTVHSFANRIYKNSGKHYKLLTADSQLEIAKELIDRKDDETGERIYPTLKFDRMCEYYDLKIACDAGKISEKHLESFLTVGESFDFKVLQEEITVYGKNNNYVTFEELLHKTREYYQTLGASVQHLLVDEFQDISTNEYNFILALNPENLFVVGDDYQSIYSFKGSNVNIFLSLYENKDYKKYILENNYRSSQEILEFADKIINQVDNKIEKKYVSKQEKKGSVDLDTTDNLEKHLDKLKSKPKDWFILTRTNKEVFDVVEMLKKHEIPYTTFKREGASMKDIEERLNKEAVKVLTVHTSKGLESKNVILYSNFFKVKVPVYFFKEEERKVMYVGVTRAKEQLILLN